MYASVLVRYNYAGELGRNFCELIDILNDYFKTNYQLTLT